MKKLRKVIVALLSVVMIISFISGIEALTGQIVLIDEKGNLVEKNEISELKIFPRIVKLEKVGDFVIKDNINIELNPGSAGAYETVEFLEKGSSQVKEETNLNCPGFKCRQITKEIQTIDKSWKTGEYVARVKDAGTQEYVYAEFKIENDL